MKLSWLSNVWDFFFFKSILLLFLTRYEEQQKLQLLLHCRALQGRRPPTMLIDWLDKAEMSRWPWQPHCKLRTLERADSTLVQVAVRRWGNIWALSTRTVTSVWKCYSYTSWWWRWNQEELTCFFLSSSHVLFKAVMHQFVNFSLFKCCWLVCKTNSALCFHFTSWPLLQSINAKMQCSWVY